MPRPPLPPPPRRLSVTLAVCYPGSSVRAGPTRHHARPAATWCLVRLASISWCLYYKFGALFCVLFIPYGFVDRVCLRYGGGVCVVWWSERGFFLSLIVCIEEKERPRRGVGGKVSGSGKGGNEGRVREGRLGVCGLQWGN